jgi:hypothetical protein
LHLSWFEAAVDSTFIPVYVTDLPKTVAMKLAGGVEWTLVVALGIGTFWNYLHKRLEAVHTIVRYKLAICSRKISCAEDTNSSNSR